MNAIDAVCIGFVELLLLDPMMEVVEMPVSNTEALLFIRLMVNIMAQNSSDGGRASHYYSITPVYTRIPTYCVI